MNTLKTTLLMTGMLVLFVSVGYAVGGQDGMVLAFALAAVMNVLTFWFSDKIVLAMYGAREVGSGQLPRLRGLVETVAASMNLPVPRLYVIDSSSPNAFATGRSPRHAAVAVTTGLMELLGDRELKGVIAHELAHIRNRDTLISVIAATFAGAIYMLARMAQFAAVFGGSRGGGDRRDGGGLAGALVLAIVAPIAALLIQMAISRSREYEADQSAGQATGDPLSLASALRLLEAGARTRAMNASPTTAHLFIVNPLKGGGLMTLFSTHPPIAERIKRLEAQSGYTAAGSFPRIIR